VFGRSMWQREQWENPGGDRHRQLAQTGYASTSACETTRHIEFTTGGSSATVPGAVLIGTPVSARATGGTFAFLFQNPMSSPLPEYCRHEGGPSERQPLAVLRKCQAPTAISLYTQTGDAVMSFLHAPPAPRPGTLSRLIGA